MPDFVLNAGKMWRSWDRPKKKYVIKKSQRKACHPLITNKGRW
jgi:hypothetical protein